MILQVRRQRPAVLRVSHGCAGAHYVPALAEGVVNGDMAYGMSPQVLAALIRIATHPRVYARPSRWTDAYALALPLLEQRIVKWCNPARGIGAFSATYAGRAKASGNLIQGCMVRRLWPIESGCEWITM